MTLNGFVSASVTHNLNRPASGNNQYRVFDFDDHTFKLDVFELVAQRAVVNPTELGFRVDFTLGESIPRVAASAGWFRDETGKAEDIDIQQAFVSWIAPAGSGLRLDIGKFVTHFGYEVIDGYDGWNDNVTRSFLFGYAIPFAHVGARASYELTPGAMFTTMMVNGWDVARDNNRSKSIGAQFAITSDPSVSIYLNAMRGPERVGNTADARTMADMVAILKLGDRWTLVGNFDWGIEENAAAPQLGAYWSGFAVYVRHAVNRSLALTARGEVFYDRDGVRTGTPQTLHEITLTPELRVTPHLIVRGDLRVDGSNVPVFERGEDLARSQPSIAFDVIYSF